MNYYSSVMKCSKFETILIISCDSENVNEKIKALKHTQQNYVLYEFVDVTNEDKMIDTIKEYVSPKRFSILAYVCVIIHFLCGVIFTASTTALRLGETEKFSCAVDTNFATRKTYVEKTCFSIYDDAYNSPVRFSAFIPLGFGSVVVVSVIYSLAVGSRIDDIAERYSTESTGTNEPLRGANQTGRRTFYVFYFYFVNLVVRSILGVLFTILQHTVLYPSGFDSKFSCVYPDIKQADPNITAAQNASVTLSSHVTCTNSAAQDKQFWGTFVSVCNVIFAIITLAEVIYLIRHQFPPSDTLSNAPWSCDSQFITEYFLRKQYLSEDIELTNSIDIYKQNVLKVSLTHDINYGPNTSLDDMFIDVVIQTGQAPHKFSKGMTRHEIYDVYMEVPKHSIRLKEIKDLFYPNKDTKGNSPRTILALGRPGIGKTVLTRKIMRDWANRIDAFYHGKIAFLFKFRWFHFEKLQNITLKKFLQFGTELSEDEFESAFEEIWNCPRNTIFIFDGLDEIGGNLAKFHDFLDQSRMFPNNPTSSMSAMFLFIKILSGNMLPGAKVLVTSRPTANDAYSRPQFDRKVEIIGFTSDKIEKYVEQFCANHEKNDLKPKILSHIESSSEIKNLCYIPVNSFIVCVTLLNCLSDPANDNPLPTTLTELYQAALVYFHKNHDRSESKVCYEKVIKELQRLAFNGMKNDHQLIFDGELVNEQMKESGLLHCLPVPFFQIQTQVCFIHLTVQEFLAAQHIVETKEPEDINKFISSHVEHGKWHLVLQFLAGLLARKMKMSDRYRSCFLAFTEHLSCRIEDENIVYKPRVPIHVLVMKCLRETEDEGIAKETAATSALKGVTCIEASRLSPTEYAAMVFVCKHLNFLASLTLRQPDFDCLLEVTKLLRERCIEKLSLELPIFDHVELGLEPVLSALTDSECCINHEHSKLTQFTLNYFNITDAGVSSLIEFLLKNAHRICLQELELKHNNITSCGISMFCDVLGNEICNQLMKLDLGWNDIGDDGVRILCNALRREEHKLQCLNIRNCKLTTESIFALVEVLSDEHCEITDLSLVGNAIGDKGVHMLCCALRKEQCKLTSLHLGNCLLTDECLPSFCEALGDERCKLTRLDLGLNAFTDKYLSLLSDTLKLEHCCLQYLTIGLCEFTDEGKRLLKDVENFEHCKARRLRIYL